jgi:hypothetical protein
MKALAATSPVGERSEQALERVGNIVGRSAKSDASSDAASRANSTAHEEIETLDLLARSVDENSLKPDVGDPVLAA